MEFVVPGRAGLQGWMGGGGGGGGGGLFEMKFTDNFQDSTIPYMVKTPPPHLYPPCATRPACLEYYIDNVVLLLFGTVSSKITLIYTQKKSNSRIEMYDSVPKNFMMDSPI